MNETQIKELRVQGYYDYHGELSVVMLNNLVNRLGVQRDALVITAGPGETLRLTVPTSPKRNTPMGENIKPML